MAVLSQEPSGHKSSQFVLFRWSYNTISNPEAAAHTAVWGWVLKVPCGCRSCLPPEKSVSKYKRIHQSLLRTLLTFVFNGIWVAILKHGRLRGQQPSFLSPTNFYHVSDSWDTGPDKGEWTPLSVNNQNNHFLKFFFFGFCRPMQWISLFIFLSTTHIIISS